MSKSTVARIREIESENKSLQAEVDRLSEISPEREEIIAICRDDPARAAQTLVDLQIELKALQAEVKQLKKDLRIALAVQGANGFELKLKPTEKDDG